MIPIYDLQTSPGQSAYATRLQRLRDSAVASPKFAQAAADIIADVKARGDDAIVEQERKFTDPTFTADRILVPRALQHEALDALDPALRRALERAIEHVSAYQSHIKPRDHAPIIINQAKLGLRFTPVDSAGLLVPGGSAVLFSTLIMLAVPALVAGVPASRLAAVNPMPYRKPGEPARDVSPVFLAVCAMLDIGRVYRIGGAQAVAALAHGTQTVQPVDMIAGPGHPVVQLAKSMVAGTTGTDGGFYGPSEIVTLADHTANPHYVTADLLAQAEHNPGKCFLVCWDAAVAQRILTALELQLQQRSRSDAIRQALIEESCIVLARNEQHACDLANELATEHLNLAVSDPQALMPLLRHAGEIFLGHQTPVAAGDYYAGPSHCLPTGTTARFTSGVSTYTFLKRTGTVEYTPRMSDQTIQDIALLANAEGLDAHAASAEIRA